MFEQLLLLHLVDLDVRLVWVILGEAHGRISRRCSRVALCHVEQLEDVIDVLALVQCKCLGAAIAFHFHAQDPLHFVHV